MDGEGSHGRTSPTCKPERLPSQSKIATIEQKARIQQRMSTRIQEMWQGSLSVLHLLCQQQNPHQHLDWSDLADQAEHHLRGSLCCLQCNLMLTSSRAVPQKTSPVCWQGGGDKRLQGKVHRAQGRSKESLGHRSGGTLQPARARGGRLQLSSF